TGKRAEQQNRREDGKEKKARAKHRSSPSNRRMIWAARLYQPGIAPGQSRSLEFGVSQRRRLAPWAATSASQAEATAFQPAKDSPKNRQEASSQWMMGVSTTPPSPHCNSKAPEHSPGPSHHFHSTPA